MVTYHHHQAAATFGLKHLNPDEGFYGSSNLGELGCYAWFLLSSTLSVLVLHADRAEPQQVGGMLDFVADVVAVGCRCGG